MQYTQSFTSLFGSWYKSIDAFIIRRGQVTGLLCPNSMGDTEPMVVNVHHKEAVT
jgi:hypothetical protein